VMPVGSKKLDLPLLIRDQSAKALLRDFACPGSCKAVANLRLFSLPFSTRVWGVPGGVGRLLGDIQVDLVELRGDADVAFGRSIV
jgi:hypothetical protein